MPDFVKIRWCLLSAGRFGSWSINAEKLSHQGARRVYLGMDSLGESSKVWIIGANNDSGVLVRCEMQSDEMPAIHCQHHPALILRKAQDLLIWPSFASMARLGHVKTS